MGNFSFQPYSQMNSDRELGMYFIWQVFPVNSSTDFLKLLSGVALRNLGTG